MHQFHLGSAWVKHAGPSGPALEVLKHETSKQFAEWHMDTKRPITDKDIEKGLRILARIIGLYGDRYWPLFDRLEQELSERRSRAERLSARLGQE